MAFEGREREILQCNMALFATREQLMYALEDQSSPYREHRLAELRSRQHSLRLRVDRLQMIA